MKRVAFYTLGCKLNFSETSTISRLFKSEGYEVVPFETESDVVVINTCSVTDNADKKCRKIVREAKETSPEAFVTIIGCYAQLKPQEIAEIPGVNAVLGASEKFRLLELLGDFERKGKAEVFATEIKEVQRYHSSFSQNDRTRTFLKVQDGCNYNCAFCTIPLARGKSRSATIEDVLANAREIAETDVKEVVLTGVNIGDFGIIEGRRQDRFFDLVRTLDEVEGIDRFRISSIEPNLLSTDIIEFVAQSRRFVPHFHIPLQSGSDNLLKAMRRRYDTTLYKERIAKIRQVMPDACIGVDVIVGFPGETEALFLETYDFLNALPISYLHVFTYSERDNTEAIQLEGVVPAQERARRSKMLRILSEKKREAFYATQEGKQEEVLFEEKVQDGMMSGFTKNYVRVSAPYDADLVNAIVPITIGARNASSTMTADLWQPVK